MDRWYMVFDEDMHGNKDMPLYFLRKLHNEFILVKHINYFDNFGILGHMTRMPKDREHAKVYSHHVHPHFFP